MSVIQGYPTTLSPPSAARQVTTTDKAGDKVGLDVCILNPSITGTFTPAITGPILITGESVGDVSAAYPTAANQVNRGALSIRNIDPLNSVFIVNATGVSLAASSPDIWEIGPNETINTDFDDTNKVNLVAAAGQTVAIQIMEIAT